MITGLVVIAVAYFSNNRRLASQDKATQVPCYFIFGDSLADSGNNNNLRTEAKVNYPPYGIDFSKGPTGRFSNGRTPVDIIAKNLGFDDYIPPFMSARGNIILKGVNYASGASGILNDSGYQQGARFSMDEQLKHHGIIFSRIAQILGNGSESTADYLGQCMYSVGMGSNDYMNNYFMPELYNSSTLYTPEEFAQLLVTKYSHQLRALYNYGARKIAILGLGQIGCAPYEMKIYGTNGTCVEEVNSAVQLFNTDLKSLINEFNTNLTDAKFTYIDAYGTSFRSEAALRLGAFTDATSPCCEVGSSNFTCKPLGSTCSDRSAYVFWDNVHPSDAYNEILGEEYYNAMMLTHMISAN